MRGFNLPRFIRRRKWCMRLIIVVLAVLTFAALVIINLIYKGRIRYTDLERKFYKNPIQLVFLNHYPAL